jgi:hypothetical protein
MSTSRINFPGPSDPTKPERLSKQHEAIRTLMSDGSWRTLENISEEVERRFQVKAPPASVSAQLRHLRKPEFGSYTVQKTHIRNGLYLYRVLKPQPIHT